MHVCKILGVFDPLPLLYELAAYSYYKINGTSVTMYTFYDPRPPPMRTYLMDAP